MQDNALIFDRTLLRRRRDRAAAGWSSHHGLLCEAADRLADRLSDIRRAFPLALELGCHAGGPADLLRGRGGIRTLIRCDPSWAMLSRASGRRIVCEPDMLPFSAQSLDLAIGVLSLHRVNDLPGALIQIRRSLKPDGLLLAVVPGPKTLYELRESLALAEMAEEGGVSPRISPFLDVREAGDLLQRAGFALPVADTETLTVEYAHPLELLHDLRRGGETNALRARKKSLRRRTLEAAFAQYRTRFAAPGGGVRATLELVTLTAWAPHASQQQPARRGSGTVHLGQALS